MNPEMSPQAAFFYSVAVICTTIIVNQILYRIFMKND
jgi:hypothetical protein